MSLIINPFFSAPSIPPMIDTTSLTLWYKGYEGVLLLGVPAVDGGAVDQVENQISITDALQATPANQATWHENEVNGKGIVRFDGSNDFFDIANTADTDVLYPLTFFFAIKIPAFTDFTMLITKGTSGATQQYSIYINPPGLTGRITYCTTATCGAQDGLTAGLWERLIVRLTPTTLQFYRNGVQQGLTGGAPAQGSVATGVFLGKRADGFFNSYDLVEMGLFNRLLTDQEIIDLDAYLGGVVGA